MTLPFAQGASDAKLKPAPSPILAVSDSFTSAAPPTLQNLTHLKPTGGGGMMDQSKLYKTHSSSCTQHVYCLMHYIPWILVQTEMIFKGLKLQKWWTRNTEWEVTEIQPSVEDVSCHYLYLWPTNHNHKLYLPRSKIHPCQHYWYLFPPQRIKTSNRFKHIYVPGVSRFVLFPISSPNHGVLWQLLAHLRDSLSIICHHQSAVVQRRTGQIQSQQNKIFYMVFTMSQTDTISVLFF